MNITKTHANLAPGAARRLEHVWPEGMPRGLFSAALLERRFSHVARDQFPGIVVPEKLPRLGRPVLVCSDRSSDELEALLELGCESIGLIDSGYGNVVLQVAGTTRAAVNEAIGTLRAALESSVSHPGSVSVAFWIQGERGGDVRHREIEAPSLDDIASNYSAAVRDSLERLFAVRGPDRGRLILWRGEPGTGKSHALRALVRTWAPWCSAHFIIDPEELFGRSGTYMLDVLTGDEAEQKKWRLVILEDAGELISSDARTLAGQALSRLLNVADGLLGQGTRTLVLITTNEPVKRLHPATRRAGRCLADIEFTPLSIEEANAWLDARGEDHRVTRPTTIAELYSFPTRAPMTAADSMPVRFGFARALDYSDDGVGATRPAAAPASSTMQRNSSLGHQLPARGYDELRVRIDSRGEDSYQVLASTRSGEVRGAFVFPFTGIEVEDFILGESWQRTGGRLDPSALGGITRFGGELFGALFRDQVYGLYRDALAEARTRGRGLRITLCLSGSPELINVPWEYLFDPPGFLGISTSTPIVRYLDLPRGHRSLAVEPPLRILGVISNPADCERLNVDEERGNLDRALSGLSKSGVLELQWLEQPTLERLTRTLQLGGFHVLHYIGHGSYDRRLDSGMLMLEDDSGWASAVGSETLGAVLHEVSSLRLAVLNACDGGRSGGRSTAVAGVTEALIRCEIPAVIAMRREISDEAAIRFSEGLYSSITRGEPVDAAVAAARFAMFASRSDGAEWGTPVLYMRAPDGQLFNLPATRPDPARAAMVSR